MNQDKLKNIYYFVDEHGANPVKAFIKDISLDERAKVFAYIGELKRQVITYAGHWLIT
jgi:hypothetical protein